MQYEITRSNIMKYSLDYYLNTLGDHFDRLEAFSTAGDIRPPYPFQWLATSKLIPGDDDCYIGIGGTPLEALSVLCREMWPIIKKREKEYSKAITEHRE